MIAAMDVERDVFRPQKSPYTDPSSVAIYARVSAPCNSTLRLGTLVEILNLSSGAIVLDVGTGTGAVATPAAAAVGPEGRVIGVDASFEMLLRSRRTPGHAVA
jgi:cyclopropane fatty-acyl-phospholipid synthase-like methyltransferase